MGFFVGIYLGFEFKYLLPRFIPRNLCRICGVHPIELSQAALRAEGAVKRFLWEVYQ